MSNILKKTLSMLILLTFALSGPLAVAAPVTSNDSLSTEWVAEYHLTKDNIPVVIKRQPSKVTVNIDGNGTMIARSVYFGTTINGLSFNDRPLILNIDMDKTTFEAAIQAAGLKVISKT